MIFPETLSSREGEKCRLIKINVYFNICLISSGDKRPGHLPQCGTLASPSLRRGFILIYIPNTCVLLRSSTNPTFAGIQGFDTFDPLLPLFTNLSYVSQNCLKVQNEKGM